MQSLNWYYHRMRSMSAAEVAWRAQGLLRDAADRVRASGKLFPSAEYALRNAATTESAPPFRVTDFTTGAEDQLPPALRRNGQWRERLLTAAEHILQHRLSFFDLENAWLGAPIDWNRDHSSGRQAPRTFAGTIDYRDFSSTGDCKLVWEPNRHHHLVVLARAYKLSGDIRFARAVVEQMESWLEQCPFPFGMNWRSPLELGIRLVNWVWAIDLIRDSGLYAGDFRRKIEHAAYLHMWDISRKYSRASSANNHTIGEAAGVFVAACYFSHLDNGSKWRDEAARILSREILEQTYPSGGTREQAFGYHLFVLKLFLVSAIIGEKAGVPFPSPYWDRLKQMIAFAGTLSEAGHTPACGDCDDAYALDLGSRSGDVTEILCIAAVVFQNSTFKRWAGGFCEPAFWLLGPGAWARFEAIAAPESPEALHSTAFPDAGLYLLQAGSSRGRDRVSVLFDCGELGFKAIAAHGHADSLSFTLFAHETPVFVDPGTYDYFTYPEWRQYFRSTRAHNTVELDGQNQSEMLGPFLWGTRANSRCLQWQPGENGGGQVSGEHDGYSRLSDPATHRRTLQLDPGGNLLDITDDIRARERHDVALWFHLSPECVAKLCDDNQILITTANGGRLIVEYPAGLTAELLSGSESPQIAGWFSRGYHQKQVSTSIALKGSLAAATTLLTRIRIEKRQYESSIY